MGGALWLFLLLVLFFFFLRRNSIIRSPGNIRSGNGFSFPTLRLTRKDIPDQEAKFDIRFTDVAGCDEAKEELKEIVDFLGYPFKYTKLGGKIPKGVLLIGPPGVGKTLLARAVAGEAKVPFHSTSASEFEEMLVGVGASRVRKLFEDARQQVPCIIFIDELDSLGNRSNYINTSGTQENTQTLNQILTEMDGFEKTTGIIVIGATNRVDKLDNALLRAGRFDRHVHINLPDIKGREEILKIHVKNVKLAEDVNLKTLARMTPGFSGADLANLVNEAALRASGKNKESVEFKDFEFAKDKILLGRENKSLSLVMTEDEKMVVAVHEAGHALVALLMPENDPLYKVSIIPRGQALGITSQLPERDRYNLSEEYLFEALCILYGGRIAEKCFFNKISTGATNDIEQATELARKMVCEFGMSELGPVNYSSKKQSLIEDISQKTKRLVDAEIRKITRRAYTETEAIISKNPEKLKKIIDALIEKETLNREEIEALVKEP